MSNSIRKIMEMVKDMPEEEDFYSRIWDLKEKYGVPDDVIEKLISDYDSHGETRWEEGIEYEQEDRRTSRGKPSW